MEARPSVPPLRNAYEVDSFLESENTVALSPYQLSQVLLFEGPGDGGEIVPFGALGGLLSDEEQAGLTLLSDRVRTGDLYHDQEPIDQGYSESIYALPGGLRGLRDFAETVGDDRAVEILDRMEEYVTIGFITREDLEPENFEKLPLMAQYSFSGVGPELLDKILYHLEEREDHNPGVLTFTQFKKPTHEYMEAIEKNGDHGSTIMQNIATALRNPSEEVERVSHGFVNVRLIPSEEYITSYESPIDDPLHPDKISRILNKKIDGVEKKIAEVVLLKGILSEEMRSSVLSMIGVVGCLPLLHFIEEHTHGDPTAQALIKFIPPLIADIVTFYVQLNPWLEGETPLERGKDFIHRLKTTHKASAGASLVGTAAGSGLSEIVQKYAGDVPAAAIYSFIPFAVAMFTTMDTLKGLKSQLGITKEGVEGVRETAVEMFKGNPAHLGIDIAAFITWLTGIWVLGVEGKLDDPTMVAAIEGAEEHTLATIFTLLQLKYRYSGALETEVTTKINDWRKREYLEERSN